MSRPRILDLFCGAGGASFGYWLAGFDVVGVDNRPQPHYPFRFVQEDAGRALEALWADGEGLFDGERAWYLGHFDAIHASPPCQAYSVANRPTKALRPGYVEPTRAYLETIGLPWVLENVPGAPMPNAVFMCGGGWLPVVMCADGRQRQLRRHRLFEASFPMMGHPCWHPFPALGVHGGGAWSNDAATDRGGYKGSKAETAAAMGIEWMGRDELAEAIPPAYTRAIAEQLLEHLRRAA